MTPKEWATAIEKFCKKECVISGTLTVSGRGIVAGETQPIDCEVRVTFRG